MFSLRDLRFVLCSRDLDALRAQRIIGFFILITHKSTRSENPITWLGVTLPQPLRWQTPGHSSRWLTSWWCGWYVAVLLQCSDTRTSVEMTPQKWRPFIGPRLWPHQSCPVTCTARLETCTSRLHRGPPTNTLMLTFRFVTTSNFF